MTVEFEVPLRIESVNRTRNRYWAVRHRETRKQHEAIQYTWLSSVHLKERKAILATIKGDCFTVTVTFTRVGPRHLDSDNIVAALKAARDTIASILHVDDADPRVGWAEPKQESRGRGVYALGVRINY